MAEKKRRQGSPHTNWLSWLVLALLDLLLFAGWSIIRKRVDDSIWLYFSARRKQASRSRTRAEESEISSDI
jgi:hypothetical protein